MQERSYPSHSDMSDTSACIDYIMDFNLTMLKIYKQSAAVWTSLKRALIAGLFHPVATWYSRQLPDTALWCPRGVINRHTHSCLVKQLARLGSGCYRGRVITDNIQDPFLTLGFPNSSMIALQLYPSISQNSGSACCLEGTAKILFICNVLLFSNLYGNTTSLKDCLMLSVPGDIRVLKKIRL